MICYLIDSIHTLGGAVITLVGDVQLGRKKESCAAISIEEPDFCATFDDKEKAARTIRWKWTMNKVSEPLQNAFPEYARSGMHMKSSCKHGLLWAG